MMKTNKIIYIGFFALVLFAMISFASAGFGDWFRGLFGEPQLGPFNATVTIQSVVPTIPIIFNVTDDYLSSLVNYVQVTPDSSSNVYVTFMANDDNGRTDLPTTPVLGTNIFVNLTYAGIRPATTSYIGSSASADTCVEVINCGSCTSNQRMYFCNLSFAMPFYYEPNLPGTPANLWVASVHINDLGGSIGAGNNTFNFSYLRLPAVQNIVNLTWFGISPSGTNQRASDNVTLINKGNALIPAVNITAYNLTGQTYPTTKAWIPARSIRVYGVLGSECNTPPATILQENAGLNVTGLSLDYGPSVQTDLRFCIFPALNSLAEGLDLTNPGYTAFGPLTTYPTTGRADWRLQLG